jgi:chemotaxis protein methyltransferase CheR
MIRTYEDFKNKIYTITKIDLSAYKERQMKRRIDALLVRHKIDDYDAFVKEISNNKKLLDEFVAYLTINVSEFYRNKKQWDFLDAIVIPMLMSRFNTKLKIWSAACSTGDEPYSLVMALSKYMPLSNIQIYATDLDKNVIEQAKVGLYNEKSIKAVPEEFRNKYFSKVGKSYLISDEIKKCVIFREHNLLLDKYERNFHMIVCRNVLIYFTEDAKNEVFSKFSNSLIDNGVLFIGSTEQIINYKKLGFSRMNSFFYEKFIEKEL